jgi:hypothetical protein
LSVPGSQRSSNGQSGDWRSRQKEFLRNSDFFHQQAGVEKRLIMVKLYSHSGPLAVLSSRSNGGRGIPPSPFALGPPASAGVGNPTIPLFYHSTIPGRAGRDGGGGRFDCGLPERRRATGVRLRRSCWIADCGFRTDGRRDTPLRPVRAGCTNKPNWPERIMQNEPNFRAEAGDPPPPLDPPASAPRRAYRAKRTQFHRPGPRRTKSAKRTQFGRVSGGVAQPIRCRSGQALRGADCAKQSQTWASWGIGGTASAGAYRAKQSQFAATPRGTGRKCAKRTQFAPAGQAGGTVAGANRAKQTQFGGSIVQNEPNLSIADFGLRIGDGPAAGCLPCGLPPRACTDRLCETKPISGRWPAGGIPTIPLFYYSTIPGRQWIRRAAGARCTNKANSADEVGWARCLWRYKQEESGRVDSNHRPLGPEPSALSQAELRPGRQNHHYTADFKRVQLITGPPGQYQQQFLRRASGAGRPGEW